jgi:Peptidase family M50
MKKYVSSSTMLFSRITVTTITTMLLLLASYVASVHSFQSTTTTPSPGFFLPRKIHSRPQPKTLKRKTASATLQHISSPSSSSSTSALHMAAPLAWLASTPLGSISVLAGIVVVHEMGHYLAAKSFGMTVEEFSIGFGPKLFGFQAPAALVGGSSGKNAEEFNLRALPLGGYVRFPENYNNTDYEERKRQALATFQAEKERAKLRQQVNDLDLGSRLLNVVTFGAVLQQRKRKQELELEKSTAAASASTQSANQLFWQQNAVRKEERAVLESVEIEYYDDPNLLQNRPWTERAVVLSAGVVRLVSSLYHTCYRVGDCCCC